MGRLIDLSGQRFGRLLVTARGEADGRGEARWVCLCGCGGATLALGNNLRRGTTRSCGCLMRERSSETHAVDETGKSFGRLRVISRSAKPHATRTSQAYWDCECSCGSRVSVLGHDLRSGNTSSCGCYARERRVLKATTHGRSRTPEHRIWTGILTRCRNANVSYFKNYGGRGIKICDRWASSFEAFFADVGPRPSPSHSIDRIDVNGNYEPGNVRWATPLEQANNRRVTRTVTAAGETLSMVAWAKRLGCDPSTIYQRIASGWSEDRAVITPIRQGKYQRREVTDGCV